MNHAAKTNAELNLWMDRKSEDEVWFVDPAHHVEKRGSTIDLGFLSHFTYELSLLALGGMSLYHAVNQDPDCPGIGDRIFVYDPLTDADGALLPNLHLDGDLQTFERRIPLRNLDIVCVSVTNADAVTVVLNLLRLGGVPLRCADREGGGYPLLLAGGPGCANPEPFVDYFDFFCIGDGRTLTKQIVRAVRELKCESQHVTTEAAHRSVGNIAGLYVPCDYRFEFSGARITDIQPSFGSDRVVAAVDHVEKTAHRSLVTDGKTAVVVPNYGCKHRCSYCQISQVDYREFEIESVLRQVEIYFERGIKTLIVNSATLTQHSRALELLRAIADLVEVHDRNITVYIGSVRFDEVEPSILNEIGRLKGFSHTYLFYTNGSPAKFMALAPEHGSQDLMKRMYRPVDPWRILDTVDEAIKQGVCSFVLYFIVGFESETIDDRDQLAALAAAVIDRIRPYGGKIIFKINPLIPTPGTACQRMPMPSFEQYRHYVDEVRQGMIRRVGQAQFDEQVEVVMLPESRLIIEAILNRADRRMGPFVEKLVTYRAGGREPDEATYSQWLTDAGLDVETFSAGRSQHEILPWQIVDQTREREERRVLSLIRKRNGRDAA